MRSLKRAFIWILLLLGVGYFVFANYPGGVVITAPTTLQNLSQNFTIIVTSDTLDDNSNVTNVTFEVHNGTGQFELIGYNLTENLTTYAIDWDTTASGVGDGTNFTINVTAAYTNQSNFTESPDASYNSTLVENVTVDNTPPTLTANEPSNNALINSTEVTFNATVVDLIFSTIATCNLTLDPDNATDGSVINTTTNVANGTEVVFINTPPIGGHTWNIACTDSDDTNNTGYTNNLTFNGGLEASGISMDILDTITRASKRTFEATDPAIIACTRSDEDGFNETTISVIVPGSNNPSVLEHFVEPIALNNTNTREITFQETRELGDYLAMCEVVDVAGNTNATNLSFTVVKKPPRSSSAFGNRDFVAPVAKIKVGKNSVSDAGSLTTEGVSRLMQVGATTTFLWNGEQHSIRLQKVSDEQATLTIASTPQEVTFNKGETKEVDVDGDGQNDILVTFHKKYTKYADLTFSLITTSTDNKEKEVVKSTSEKDTSTKASLGSTVTIILVIIIILVIGYYFLVQRKK